MFLRLTCPCGFPFSSCWRCKFLQEINKNINLSILRPEWFTRKPGFCSLVSTILFHPSGFFCFLLYMNWTPTLSTYLLKTLPDLELCLKGTGPLLRLQLQEENFETSSLCTAETWWGSPPQGSRLHYSLQEKEKKSSSRHWERDSFYGYSNTCFDQSYTFIPFNNHFWPTS